MNIPTLEPSANSTTLDMIVSRICGAIRSILSDGPEDVSTSVNILDITVFQYPDCAQPHIVVSIIVAYTPSTSIALV